MDLESLSADEYSLEDQDFYDSNPRPMKMSSNSKPFRKVVSVTAFSRNHVFVRIRTSQGPRPLQLCIISSGKTNIRTKITFQTVCNNTDCQDRSSWRVWGCR